MNEQELERRFRSVMEGPQPVAPESLRRFLYDLPLTHPIRPANRYRALHRSLSRPRARPRLALGAAAIAFAVVAGLVVGNLMLAIRGASIGGNPSAGVETPGPTFSAGGFLWTGNLEPAAVPVVAVAGGPDGYLGVGSQGESTGMLLTSHDALHWAARQTSGIDPKDVQLEWIAHGDNGFVAVGATRQGSVASGRPRPRFFYSADGNEWHESVIEDALQGAPALRVVAGPKGFLAAGWNGSGTTTQAGSGGTYLWASTDGRTWAGGSTRDAVDGRTFLMWARDFYLISGHVMAGGNQWQGLLPIFESKDGLQSWGQASGQDALAAIGPAISGAAGDTDTQLLLLVWATAADETSANGRAVLINGDAGVFKAVSTASGSPGDLRSLARVGGTTVLATAASGSIYVSPDWGANWHALDFGAASPRPLATNVLDLGNGTLLLSGRGGIWKATPV